MVTLAFAGGILFPLFALNKDVSGMVISARARTVVEEEEEGDGFVILRAFFETRISPSLSSNSSQVCCIGRLVAVCDWCVTLTSKFEESSHAPAPIRCDLDVFVESPICCKMMDCL